MLLPSALEKGVNFDAGVTIEASLTALRCPKIASDSSKTRMAPLSPNGGLIMPETSALSYRRAAGPTGFLTRDAPPEFSTKGMARHASVSWGKTN